MTTDRSYKTFVVAVAALVALGGGGAMAAFGSSSTPIPADTGGGNAAVAAQDGGPSASATFEAQKTDGWTVTLDRVVVPEGGFITIHDAEMLADGKVLESVLGTSVYLEPGTYEDLTVELDQRLPAGEVALVAMPHRDTNGNQQYDFVSSEGAADGPYTADGSPVVDDATVTVDVDCPPADPTTDPTPVDTPAEETVTPTDAGTEAPTDDATATQTDAATPTDTPADPATDTPATETPADTPTQTPADTPTATPAGDDTPEQDTPEPDTPETDTPAAVSPSDALEITHIDASDEYFVIQNTGNAEIDLSGYMVDIEMNQPDNQIKVLPADTTLAPNEELRIGTGSKTEGEVDVSLGFTQYRLNNQDPDTVGILDPDGNVVVEQQDDVND